MDCEKFESAMMDELYGELDELTSAAAKRHVAGCARCSALLGGLRATRRVATVPLVDPPADLEDRILAAVKEAQKVVPFGRRVAHAVSVAGSWAMRPQTAMAALFLVMIGTSVLLLRGKARAPVGADVRVTEQGAPAAEPAPAASVATVTTTADLPMSSAAPMAGLTRAIEAKPVATATAAPADLAEEGRGYARGPAKALAGKDKDDQNIASADNASAPGGLGNTLPPAAPTAAAGGAPAQFGQAAQAQLEKKAETSPMTSAIQAYRGGRFDDATHAFDALAPSDPNAELWAARSVRESKGCSNALARFDKVAQRAGGTPPGWDALLEGALCYRAVGNFNNARVRLSALLKVDSHKDRAQAEIDRLNQLQQAQASQAPAAAAARPSPKREAAPAPPAATTDQKNNAF
jgi:Putative zinc-finger